MRKSLVFLPLLFFLISCQPKKQNPCNIKTNNFSLSNNTILLETKNNKSCRGFKIKLIYNKEIFTFYVNFEPKIVNNAPPYGFSVKIPNKDYLSLGVDGNIFERNLPVYLRNESKIEILKDYVLVRWVIKPKDINRISKIEIGNVIIKHPSNKDCQLTYNDYLTTPRQKPTFYPFDKFLNFCKSKWLIERKDKPFRVIFRVSDEDIKELQKRGNVALLSFLGFVKQKTQAFGDRCNIHILLYDSKNYKRLNPTGFRFHLKKLNKEAYEMSFDEESVAVASGGVYVIRTTSSEYWGKSRIIICKKGEYYVAILVRSKI
ncbi:hypothetical protein [Hippea maritima]|uniref:Lipoprotein n=1 Tax=Hippea maritima (strain ATCC 700847 / DSM 10411 / MH2) TaxID=760142 RepID=F2LUA1_HIPMA|nr:hypothetical protein [Hippea maritima]AEA34564.1 hypothetical protein Hipma_1614 [Hippea maritima DSM 10411]